MGDNSIDKNAINRALEAALDRYQTLTLLRTAIQAIPYIGGPLDTLLCGKGAKVQERRFLNFVGCLRKELSKIEEKKIDYEFLESEEFFSIFQSAAEKSIRTHEQEKIHLFSRILSNSALTDYSHTPHKEGFINAVADLSTTHISILRYILDKWRQFIQEDARKNRNHVTLDEVAEAFPNLAKGRIEAYCNDLTRYGFLYDWWIGRIDYERGLYGVTDYTKEFVRFIQSSSELESSS